MRTTRVRIFSLCFILPFLLVGLAWPIAGARRVKPAIPIQDERSDRTRLASNPLVRPQLSTIPAPFRLGQSDNPAMAQAAIAAAERSLEAIRNSEPGEIDWRSVYPRLRYGHAMAYDSSRGVVVLFGGYCGSRWCQDGTWEWDGTDWVQRRSGSEPAARNDHAMAYDSSRGVVVLFGGVSTGDRLDDTWEWDGTNWVQRSETNHPAARNGHAMAYDSARGVAILFGGVGDTSPYSLDDTWEWDGTNWIEHNPIDHPSVRHGHAMAYDSVRGVTVLFGGYCDDAWCQDGTWEWDGANWMEYNPTNQPSVRYRHAMAYDTAREVIILFGGVGDSDKDDTWEWDGTNWLQRSPTSHPAVRYGHAMAYDSAQDEIVLFGGRDTFDNYPDDIWGWDGMNWVQRSIGHPAGRSDHAMAYDSKRGLVVLFGGIYPSTPSFLDDTWEWNGANWVERTPTNYPSARSRHTMAYDSERGVVVLFGGRVSTGSRLDDTWEWDGIDWVQRTSASHPSGRERHAMAYDSTREVIVLFGGVGDSSPYSFDDTWEWDGIDWVQCTPASHPEARRGHAMAYDSARRVTVLFGGFGEDSLNDTWEWDGTNWIERNPINQPSVRYGHTMAYDSTRAVVVLFGGRGGGYKNDTWEWDGTNWEQRTPTSHPSERDGHAMTYDSAREVVVLSGGLDGKFLGELWEYGKPLPPPTLSPIANADGDGDYLVQWSTVGEAITYTLQEDDYISFISPTVRYCGDQTAFQVLGQNGGSWYYRVKVSNTEYNSYWSNIETVYVTPTAPLLYPIENADGDGSFLVDWSDVIGATTYELEEDGEPGFDSPLSRYQGIDTQFEVSGQPPGNWHYRVRALNAGGNSPWSDPQAVTVLVRIYLPLVVRNESTQ